MTPRTAGPVAAPQVAQSFAYQATSAPAATSIPETESAASSEMAANAVAPSGTPQAGEPTPEATPAPLMMGAAAVTDTTQAHGGGGITEPTETPPAISAKQPATDTAEISVADTAAVTQAQRAAVMAAPRATPETSMAAAAPPAEQPVPVAPETPWLRIVAGLALLIAVGTGIAGWARR